MKKILIPSSILIIVLGFGGWYFLQNQLERERKQSSIRSRQRQQEIDNIIENFDEKVSTVTEWKPLGSVSGDTAEKILAGISRNYDFDRFIDTWGRNGRALYIPSEAWNKLTDKQRDILTKYAQSSGLRAINIGKLKSNNNMYIDSTVWGN